MASAPRHEQAKYQPLRARGARVRLEHYDTPTVNEM